MLPRLLLSSALIAFPGVPRPTAEVRTVPQGREYCEELSARLAPLPGAAQEPARSLAEEGMTMCREGHVRTGVARLRRALRTAQGR
ncbi:hypothetical protein [Roseomonas haemaphysalidis]|uniref:Uncharacterized protein n=1 Tax=Roseomonas haemaphysalidis TaxID=2768162 RepID=A0ABS3KPI6_9PROT|nr:hypothetical protein [Roseomonas haemaphysalidis]MBO1079394.1 hypothetical protein [Roseomonas haemaphysalidis]